MEKEKQINKKIDKAYISSLAFNADECEICLSDEVKKEYGLKFKNGKFLFFKKRPKYPKTYTDCCKALLLNPEKATYSVCGLEYKRHLIVNFQRLLVCRDAYWKIAGDWKPEFRFGKKKYCIMTKDNKVINATVEETNRILAFPTEEMRDAFYENFKELIEECKELL